MAITPDVLEIFKNLHINNKNFEIIMELELKNKLN